MEENGYVVGEVVAIRVTNLEVEERQRANAGLGWMMSGWENLSIMRVP